MIFALVLTLAMEPQRLPSDVSTYVARRDQCDHFRGEEAADEARRREIEAATIRFCKGVDQELARLKRIYQHHPAVQTVLDRYDPRIED